MIRWLRYRQAQRRHPQRFALLGQLLPIQSMTRDQVLHQQRRDLAGIIEFAATHTDFYRDRFEGLPAAVQLAEDPSLIPVLTKQDVLDHRDALLARDADRSRIKLGHTGGSTGRPVAFYYDDAKHELMLAGMMRGFMMSGWRPGERVLYFWGAGRDVRPGGVFDRYGGNLLAVEHAVAAVEYSEPRLRQWAELVRRWRPRLLYGYASALTELAGHVIASRTRMPTSLIGVYSTAEMLHDWQRELMQRAFGCKVFNQYGCREVPNIAWECRAGNMHVFTDMVYVESLPGEGDNRLLVTSLTNRLMPFIRYDLGDSGRLLEGECDCGSPLPLMQMDLCRHNDLIRTPGGTRVHPAYFNRLLYGIPHISQYQWVQTTLDQLRLDLVSDRPLPGEVLQAIEARIRRELDIRMQLEVRYLADIPRTAAGKHRFVIGLQEPGNP